MFVKERHICNTKIIKLNHLSYTKLYFVTQFSQQPSFPKFYPKTKDPELSVLIPDILSFLMIMQLLIIQFRNRQTTHTFRSCLSSSIQNQKTHSYQNPELSVLILDIISFFMIIQLLTIHTFRSSISLVPLQLRTL